MLASSHGSGGLVADDRARPPRGAAQRAGPPRAAAPKKAVAKRVAAKKPTVKPPVRKVSDTPEAPSSTRPSIKRTPPPSTTGPSRAAAKKRAAKSTATGGRTPPSGPVPAENVERHGPPTAAPPPTLPPSTPPPANVPPPPAVPLPPAPAPPALTPPPTQAWSAGPASSQPAPPPWPPPAPAPGPAPGIAIAALVAGIVSVPLFWSLAAPIVALVVSGIALRRVRREGRGGKGLAVTGTVLGGVSLLAFIALAVAVYNQADENLVDEDFSTARPRFSTDSDPLVDLSVVDGTSRIRIMDASSPQTIRSFFDRSRGGVRFEATLNQLVGPEQEAVSSVGCWNGDTAYLLVITPTGEAGLVETVSDRRGERRPLTDLLPVDSARPPGEPNRLRIDCVGGGRQATVVSGWVNGEPVASVAVADGYDSFSAVGFWVATNAPGTEFSVDDVLAVADRPDPPMPPVPPIPPE